MIPADCPSSAESAAFPRVGGGDPNNTLALQYETCIYIPNTAAQIA